MGIIDAEGTSAAQRRLSADDMEALEFLDSVYPMDTKKLERFVNAIEFCQTTAGLPTSNSTAFHSDYENPDMEAEYQETVNTVLEKDLPTN